jgi:hypothetical protein
MEIKGKPSLLWAQIEFNWFDESIGWMTESFDKKGNLIRQIFLIGGRLVQIRLDGGLWGL